MRTRRLSSRPLWQATCCAFTIVFAENWVPTPRIYIGRRTRDRPRPRAVDINYAKTAETPQARDDSMLQLTENHETLIRRASEQAEFARTMEIGQFHITNESVTDGNGSCPLCREDSDPRNSRYSRCLAILHDHVEIGPVTEIEVFESAGALVLEVQEPSQQQGHVKSWVRISQGIEQYARQSVPEQY